MCHKEPCRPTFRYWQQCSVPVDVVPANRKTTLRMSDSQSADISKSCGFASTLVEV